MCPSKISILLLQGPRPSEGKGEGTLLPVPDTRWAPGQAGTPGTRPGSRPLGGSQATPCHFSGPAASPPRKGRTAEGLPSCPTPRPRVLPLPSCPTPRRRVLQRSQSLAAPDHAAPAAPHPAHLSLRPVLLPPHPDRCSSWERLWDGDLHMKLVSWGTRSRAVGTRRVRGSRL